MKLEMYIRRDEADKYLGKPVTQDGVVIGHVEKVDMSGDGIYVTGVLDIQDIEFELAWAEMTGNNKFITISDCRKSEEEEDNEDEEERIWKFEHEG
jgi:hypothetical protein